MVRSALTFAFGLGLAGCVAAAPDSAGPHPHSSPSGKADVAVDNKYLWPGGDVHLVLDVEGVSEATRLEWRARLRTARHELARHTPVRLHIHSDVGSAPPESRVLVAKDYGGGSAPLGTQGGVPNVAAESDPISLRHEIGHLLGLLHTHQRVDRENHIVVHERWVHRELKDDVAIEHGRRIIGPYDEKSVMHYGSFSGAIRNEQGEVCALLTPAGFGGEPRECVTSSELGEHRIEAQWREFTDWNYTVISALYCEPRFCGEQCAPAARCNSSTVQEHLKRLHAWEASEREIELRKRYHEATYPLRDCAGSRQEIVAALRTGDAPRRSPLGCAFDLREADLSDADLSGMDLHQTRAVKANLHGANLSEANLELVQLKYADVTDATLDRAELHSASLFAADFARARIQGASLRNANAGQANLEQTNLREADLDHASLAYADLSGANLDSAVLRDADLEGADLTGANLTGANLQGADLSGATIEDARLCNAQHVDLQGAAGVPAPCDG
jgi:hypothetical protein